MQSAGSEVGASINRRRPDDSGHLETGAGGESSSTSSRFSPAANVPVRMSCRSDLPGWTSVTSVTSVTLNMKRDSQTQSEAAGGSSTTAGGRVAASVRKMFILTLWKILMMLVGERYQ